MTGYQIGILAHLIGVILFFAGVAIAAVVVSAARSRENPSEIALILGLARHGAILLAAGGVILLLAGFYVSGKIDGYGQRWLEISILLFVVSLVLGYLGGRRSRSVPMRLAASRVSASPAPASWSARRSSPVPRPSR